MDAVEKARVYDCLTFLTKLVSRHIRAQSPDDLTVTANCIALADFAAEFNRKANACLRQIADATAETDHAIPITNDPRM